MELLSVIVPTRNAAATLPDQLGALAAQTYDGPWELVVVDNGSTDASATLAAAWADRLPKLRVVDAPDRLGINYARNAGAVAAGGSFLLFCDADDVVTPTWLAAMAEAAPDYDLLGGSLDSESLNDRLALALRPGVAVDRLPVALRYLPYAVGANCGVRATVHRELGGFDERHAVGGADVEFFWRAQLRGYRLGFVQGAVVQYRYRRGLRPMARQYYRYGMAEAQLYRNFRRYGLGRTDTTQAALEWAWILRHVPDLRHPGERRGRWLVKASYRGGRLRGSLRHRVLLL